MPDPTPAEPRPRCRSDPAVAAALALVALVALVATSRDYAMIWDEGHTVRRDRALASWFARVAAGGADRAEALSPRGLAAGWPFSRAEPDGHPPFYALLGLAGWVASRGWADPLTCYRLGPMALAAATVGVVYLDLARRRGRLAGAVGAGSILLIPPAFSLAHYAHYDMPLSCLWLLAQMAFLKAMTSSRWIVPFGVALGLAAGTKFTGLFAVVPPLLWTFGSEWLPRVGLYPSSSIRPPRRATLALLAGLAVAAATLYAIHPPWWFDPLGGPWRFVASNLTRSATKPIPTMYLGRFYAFALPWHNTLVLTAASVPLGILFLGISGIGASVARRPADREGVFWVLSWGTLMVVRALPNAPGHDGVRLFLPSVLSLAVLAGIGAEAWRRLATRLRARWLAPTLSAAALGGGLAGIVDLYPYTLSYYNAGVGGLRGADRLGLELTYYWDTMGPEFFEWVRQRRAEGPLALRFPSVLVNFEYLREWGDLPRDVALVGYDPGPEQGSYVLQRRRGFFYPYDWWLERNGRPEFRVSRQGVDLLRVYPFEQSLRAFEATRGEAVPDHLRN